MARSRCQVLVWLFACFIACFIKPGWVAAQVVINELYPNPNTGEEEWLELYNAGNQAVELSGWQVWDQLSSSSLVYQFNTSTLFDPQALLVINLHNVLNNSGDALTLKNAGEQIIDFLSYSSSTKGQSWSRDPNDLTKIYETTPTKNLANVSPISTLSPTPSPNLTPTPTPNPTNLLPQLSEIMACPADTDEWVELFNPHQTEISLNGFSLRDSKSQIFAFTSQTISPLGYLVLEFRNILNNSGDSVSLISPTQNALETHSYTQCSAESSWSKNGDIWQQTPFISRGSVNIFALTEIEATASADVDPTYSKPKVDPLSSVANKSMSAAQSVFLYPPSVLQPKLDYDKTRFNAGENFAYFSSVGLERGALDVIIGSLFLLIPGIIYVKNRAQLF